MSAVSIPIPALCAFPDDAAMRAETVFVSKPISAEAVPARSMPTCFNVVNEDCLDVAAKHVREGYLPCVHNFASRSMPGGGVVTGSGAQEESIFRRTNAYKSLYQFIDNNTLRSLLARDPAGGYSRCTPRALSSRSQLWRCVYPGYYGIRGQMRRRALSYWPSLSR